MRKTNLIIVLLLVLILGVCLVACGEENVKFTVTFDTQGGSEIAPIIVETGKEITLPENPTKDGYIFDGWYIDKDLLNEFVETQTISENITLYAKWACPHNQCIWIDEVPAKCPNSGMKGHYECVDCNACLDTYYNEIYDLTLSLDKKAHNYDNNGVCESCGYFETDLEFELNDDGESWSVVYSWAFQGPELEIPKANYDAKPVTEISAHAFTCAEFINVIIPDSITSISAHAFAMCENLKSITFCEDSQLSSIGERAFYNCSSLESITIPDSVTSIGEWAFNDCTSLVRVTLGSGVASIGEWAFGDCYKLIEVCNKSSLEIVAGSSDHGKIGLYARNICAPDFDSEIYVDDNGYMIYAHGNNKILVGYIGDETELVLPDDITEINQYAFNSLPNITSITIPDSVTSIGEMAFFGCENLESITIPFVGATRDGTIDTDFDYIFGYGGVPSSLKTVVITGGSSIGYRAFDGCSGVTSVTIPDSVTRIDDWAFSDCTGLTSVTIGNSVTNIGDWAFYGCDKLIEVYNKSSLTITPGNYDNGWVGNYAKNVYTDAEGENKLSTDENGYIIYTDGDEKILVAYTGAEINLTLPSDITQIYEYAFYNCSKLTSVIIPDGVTSIGDYAFFYCTSLTNIIIPSSVTSIGDSAFVSCSSLTSITIPDSVTSIGDEAFCACTSLESVTMGSGVTNIGTWVFRLCSSLTNITIPDSVTSIGINAFNECSSLTSIIIPSSVTSIDSSAFSECSGLESVTVESGNTAYHSDGNCLIETDSKTLIAGCKNSVIPNDGSVTSIDKYAFDGCSGLTSIIIPDSVTSIEGLAFGGCSGLTSVTIGNGVTRIDSSAFSDCSSLTSITIPDSVTSIGADAFYGCSGLKSITFEDTTTWYRTDSYTNWVNKTGGIETSVTNTSTNATYFKSTYYNYYWYKL